jgi:hypothetical protein
MGWFWGSTLRNDAAKKPQGEHATDRNAFVFLDLRRLARYRPCIRGAMIPENEAVNGIS